MANTALIGIAGVHYVASELARRGMVALPTVRNTAGFDIVVTNPEGTRHANVQVKTSGKKVVGFPMPPADKIRTGPRDYYVLARWVGSETEGKYECFLLTGRQTRDEIRRTDRIKRAAIRAGTRTVLFPGVAVGPSNQQAADRWRRAWQRWRL
jgi:hypothetical protein